MSKKAERQQSFQTKMANWSTRIQANGRMELLPAEAKEMEIRRGSIRESLDALANERRRLEQDRLKVPVNSEEWNRLNESLNRIRGNFGNATKMLMECKSMHWAVVFHFVAEQMLTHQAYMMLRDCTHQLLGKPPKQQNGK